MKQVTITKEMLQKSYDRLTEQCEFDWDYVLLTIFATAICAFGFRMNSPSVIIGSMVIAPLLFPVVGIGAALFQRQWSNLFRNLQTLFLGVFIAILISVVINAFYPTANDTEISSRLTGNSIDYFFVAFFCGLAGAFAYYWPGVNEAIVGIGISVALIPPVVIIGIGLAELNMALSLGGVRIVLTNILGILLGSFFAIVGLNKYSKNHNS